MKVTLVDATLAARFLKELPQRLIGDKAYDSDRLDQHLAATYHIELIAPHLPHRRTRTQDGRPLRRRRRRWKIERLFRLVPQLPGASSRAGSATLITFSG
jgi:hypothetical protein